MTQLYVLLFLLVVLPSDIQGVTCHTGWIKNKMDSKCYKLFSTMKSWNEAKAACGQEHAKLAEIKDFKSNDFIRTKVGTKAWIGSYRCGEDTCFLDNSYAPYTPYAPDQPDMKSDQLSTNQTATNLKKDDFAILIQPDGRWADEFKHNNYPYICEMRASRIRTCKHIQESGLGTTDGEYDLYLSWPQCNRSTKIYCAEMNTKNPKEYVSLPAGSSGNFVDRYNNSLGFRKQKQWTGFEKIRLNVTEMTVVLDDFKFANSSIPGVFNRFATTGDCLSFGCHESDRKGSFQVDLSGTSFLLQENMTYSFHCWPQCTEQLFMPHMNADFRKWSARCGGFCCGCWPERLQLEVDGC